MPVPCGVPSRKLRMLHLFSGPKRGGDLEDWLVRLGTAQGFDVVVDSIDTCRPNGEGDCGDILNAELFKRLKERCSKGVYVIVHAGVPCNTWSAARFLNCDKPGYPKPMRTRTFPCGGDPGYPMTKAQTAKCDRHTEIFRRTVTLLKFAAQAGAVIGLENPEDPGETLNHRSSTQMNVKILLTFLVANP